MKIISKYKDYYDYLSGIYGIDDKKILDRTIYKPMNYVPDEFILIICGISFKRILLKNFKLKNKFDLIRDYYKPIVFTDKYVWLKHKIDEFRIKKDYPIVLSYYSKDYPYYPLNKLDFVKVMEPEEIYKMLENYISYKEPILNLDPDDMLRFESKGFDKKTSFRKHK